MPYFECDWKTIDCYVNLKRRGSDTRTGDKVWGVHTGWVYELWQGAELVYVGQTVNPVQRFKAHRRDKKFNLVKLYQVNADKLNMVEGLLIVKNMPRYNRAICSPVLGIGYNRNTADNSQKYSCGGIYWR